MSKKFTWAIDAQHATLSQPGLIAKLDLLDPARGLHELQRHNQALTALRALLGVSFETRTPLNPELLLDAYARQGDLVVAYATSSRRDVAVQTYWRGCEGETLGVVVPLVDLQASVQTALLDSVPSIYTYNVAAANEVWQPRDGQARDWDCVWRVGQPSFLLAGDSHPACWLLKLDSAQADAAQSTTAAGSLSLLVMVQPGDLQAGRAVIDPAEPHRVALVCNLLHEHLEKGVIRRVWQRVALIDSARDLEVAGELYRAFERAEPSLTV